MNRKKWENEKGRDVTTEKRNMQKKIRKKHSGPRTSRGEAQAQTTTTTKANAIMTFTYVVYVCVLGVHKEDQQQNTIQNKIAHPRPTVLCRRVEREEQLNEMTKNNQIKLFCSMKDITFRMLKYMQVNSTHVG